MSTATASAAIIDKIRKILDRTQEAGCTQAEADTAMALASRLMAENAISMAQIRAADPETWMEKGVYGNTQVRLIVDVAAKLTEDFFFVSAYKTQKFDPENGGMLRIVMFFGQRSQVETAEFVFNSLMNAIDRLWREHRAATGYPLTSRKNYTMGIAQGFRAKMNADRAEMCKTVSGVPGVINSTELALRNIVAEIKRNLAVAHPDFKFRGGKTSYRRDDAFEAGFDAGRNLNINRPIGGSGPKAIERK